MRVIDRKHIIKIFGKEPSTLDELAECVIQITNSSCYLSGHGKKRITKNYELVGYAWDISYRDNVSNTHSCPVNGVTNWSGEHDKPRGYPGFYGRVWIRYSNEPSGFGSDGLRSTMTHTGTGGAGGYSGPWETLSSVHFKRYGYKSSKEHPRPQTYSWDYTIFLDDWPEIKNMVEKQRTMFILKNPTNNKFKLEHKFLWNDPATEEADKKMLQDIKNLVKN